MTMSRLAFIFLFLELVAATAYSQRANGWPADFPSPPKTDKSLFFIQRNRNKNTIVYDLNMSGNAPNKSKPIDVYWRRYGSTGERSELTWLQRNFAFGYNSKKDHTGEGYWITLTAYDGRRIHIEKLSDGKWGATMTVNGKYCRLKNVWVYADESGSWPKVIHVDLHGINMVSGKEEIERIVNK